MDEQKNKYCYLNAIKSIYILKRIFDYTTPIKKLNIIRYNNNIKAKLNINLDDYIENQYIVIEIYPYSMKRRRRNKKFINISSEKDESLCHIYFDDDNETEIKRYYLSGHEKLSENRNGSCPITSTIRSPLASFSTFSIESVRRFSIPSFTTRRSTTISILCLMFLSNLNSSSSSY